MKDLTLYILMRNDLSSMSVGRCMAQASHASNAFINKYCKYTKHYCVYVKEWQNQTKQGFGTAIVLACNINDINDIITKCKTSKYACDFVYDPEYSYLVDEEISKLIDFKLHTKSPIKRPDGKIILNRKELTCAYAFGDRNDLKFKSLFSNLNLY
jgi:peptidyl-tRNA hydrolase